MNKVSILGLAVSAAVIAGCQSSSSPESTVKEDSLKTEQVVPQDSIAVPSKSDTLKVTGVISKIENGKDGYMATLKDSTGKEFVATISIVNLQKSGGKFKRYKEGEKITVSGPSWKDEGNVEHITVTGLE
ncbi:MAG: hypothetical protein DI535_23170 [Citrobacter freundii]|nr:MAG: hypothetical protein DI535_23170 [Citrobacter freundii]